MCHYYTLFSPRTDFISLTACLALQFDAVIKIIKILGEAQVATHCITSTAVLAFSSNLHPPGNDLNMVCECFKDLNMSGISVNDSQVHVFFLK